MSTKCRYCGSTSYGSTCIHSPTRKHEHRDDEKHCEWCGSSAYGSTCIHSPTRKHRHGPVGKIELYFHPELLRFMSLDKEHKE